MLAGATGLVGSRCLRLLLEGQDYSKVLALGRRPPPLSHPKLEPIVADLSRPEAWASKVRAHAVFCCLGTTRARAGSAAAFRAVDLDMVAALARAASENGAGRFLLVSSVGADPASAFLYPRTKGEAERAVRLHPFNSVHLLRPSFLLGERADERPAERLALRVLSRIAPAMIGPLRKYRPIGAEAVAQALVRLSLDPTPGVFTHELGLA